MGSGEENQLPREREEDMRSKRVRRIIIPTVSADGLGHVLVYKKLLGTKNKPIVIHCSNLDRGTLW